LRRLRGEQLTVSVNEQNQDALRFYQACGFVVGTRSDTDGDGRPFPLLHMRRGGSPGGSSLDAADRQEKN